MPSSSEIRFSLTRAEIVGAIQQCYQAKYQISLGPLELIKIDQDIYTYRIALAILNNNLNSLPTAAGVA